MKESVLHAENKEPVPDGIQGSDTEEICIRIALLNRFNAQGTAEIVRLD
ncbi:MAG: hypothetical protein WA873_13475 [Jannaschia helgolandensis]|jgi:hypothetical protein